MENATHSLSTNTDARGSFLQVVIWCLSVPILASWTLVSLLPAVSVLRAWGSFVDVMIALGFLATGAFGLIGAAVAYRWLLADASPRPAPSAQERTYRIVSLTTYALVWMAVYAVW